VERVAQQLHDVAVNTVYDRPTVPRLSRAVVRRAAAQPCRGPPCRDGALRRAVVRRAAASPCRGPPCRDGALRRAEVRGAGLPYVALIRARIAADIMYSPHRPAARLLSRRQLGEHRVADDCIRSSLTDPCFLAGSLRPPPDACPQTPASNPDTCPLKTTIAYIYPWLGLRVRAGFLRPELVLRLVHCTYIELNSSSLRELKCNSRIATD